MECGKNEILLRRKQVEAITGLSRSTLYSAIQSGSFPKPVQLLGRTVAWPKSRVDKWVADRVSAADGKSV